MFPKNSAFTQSRETEEYHEGLRRKALEGPISDNRAKILSEVENRVKEVMADVSDTIDETSHKGVNRAFVRRKSR